VAGGPHGRRINRHTGNQASQSAPVTIVLTGCLWQKRKRRVYAKTCLKGCLPVASYCSYSGHATSRRSRKFTHDCRCGYTIEWSTDDGDMSVNETALELYFRRNHASDVWVGNTALVVHTISVQ